MRLLLRDKELARCVALSQSFTQILPQTQQERTYMMLSTSFSTVDRMHVVLQPADLADGSINAREMA